MRTTFKIASDLKSDYLDHLRATIGIKKKSAWICAAICALSREDPRLAWVGPGDALFNNTATDILTLDEKTQNELKIIIKNLRRIQPLLEAPKGLIIRSAIREMYTRERADLDKAQSTTDAA